MSSFKFPIAVAAFAIVTVSAPAIAGDSGRFTEAYRVPVLDSPLGSSSAVAARHRNLEHPMNIFTQPDASRFKISHATN